MGKFGAGPFVVVEGREGVGKSTLCFRIAETFGTQLTREPGGTSIGRQIRQITHDVSHFGNMASMTEVLLMSADRAQHHAEIIIPNILNGRGVTSDRSWVSTLAYQGGGRGVSKDLIRKVTEVAIGEYMHPDVLLILDAPTDVVVSRMKGRELDRFESEDQEFHERVAGTYREIARDREFGAILLDATKDPEDVFMDARKAIEQKLKEV